MILPNEPGAVSHQWKGKHKTVGRPDIQGWYFILGHSAKRLGWKPEEKLMGSTIGQLVVTTGQTISSSYLISYRLRHEIFHWNTQFDPTEILIVDDFYDQILSYSHSYIATINHLFLLTKHLFALSSIKHNSFWTWFIVVISCMSYSWNHSKPLTIIVNPYNLLDFPLFLTIIKPICKPYCYISCILVWVLYC